jgi:hypothetical protein
MSDTGDDWEKGTKQRAFSLHHKLNKDGQPHQHHQNISFHNRFIHSTLLSFEQFLLFGILVLNHNL